MTLLEEMAMAQFPDIADKAAQFCEALKKKWKNNDHDVDIAAAERYYGVEKGRLIEIARWYESELISTTFNIIDDEVKHVNNF